MSDFAYSRLTELDRSFLIYEGPNSPMHVGAVTILEGGPLRGADHAIDFDRVLDYVASRLHLIPRYRQHVEAAPLDGHPIWVDDQRFNLRYHVRHTRLPRPGSERILKRTCARILEQRLDLHKPLWELWLVEGLDDDRVAFVSKTHHCMIDGVSGADLLAVLMTPEPTEKAEPPPVWLPRRAPTALEYAASEATRRLSEPLHAAAALGRIVTDRDHARGEFAERLRAVGHLAASAIAGASPTPLNQPIGPHRRFDWLPMSLDDIAVIRARLGGTVNDVVLAVTAGAIRRFLKHVRLTDPDGLEFKVLAPVSLRDPRNHDRAGNRVAAWFVPLPIQERDPLVRLSRIRQTTDDLKRRHEALGAETVTQALEWLGTTPISLGARTVETSPPFNMVVTNVPGPRGPLYLLDAKMLEAHPMVPLMGSLSVGIALFSYQRTISWGFTADWDLVPDLHDLVLAVQRAFDQLLDRARRAPEPRRADPTKRRATHPKRRARLPAFGPPGTRRQNVRSRPASTRSSSAFRRSARSATSLRRRPSCKAPSPSKTPSSGLRLGPEATGRSTPPASRRSSATTGEPLEGVVRKLPETIDRRAPQRRNPDLVPVADEVVVDHGAEGDSVVDAVDAAIVRVVGEQEVVRAAVLVADQVGEEVQVGQVRRMDADRARNASGRTSRSGTCASCTHSVDLAEDALGAGDVGLRAAGRRPRTRSSRGSATPSSERRNRRARGSSRWTW